MTKERITFIRRITPWPTLLLTIGGAAYSAFISANLWGFGTTLLGTAIGAFDRHLAAELAKLEKEAKDEAEKRIEELEGMAYEADEMLRDPHFKRLVERERMDYMIDHQDDYR